MRIEAHVIAVLEGADSGKDVDGDAEESCGGRHETEASANDEQRIGTARAHSRTQEF